MEKKWWYLVLVLLILAIAVFSAAELLNKRPIKMLQGGVVVNPYSFPLSPENDKKVFSDNKDKVTSSDGSSTVSDGDWAEADDDGGPPPVILPQCWNCSLGGFILNVPIENLTDELVQQLTNCTNVSQLIPIACPTNITDQTNATCGDGICEGNETVENCPEDCSVEDGGGEGSTGNGGGFSDDDETNERSDGTDQTQTQEEPGIEYYYASTFDNRCVKLIQQEGEKRESTCNPKDNSILPSPEADNEGSYFGSFKETLFTWLLKRMFGLPSD
jgi:hypothetical protein